MRLILPKLKPCLLDLSKIKDLTSTRRYEETLYAANGVFRRESGSLKRVIPLDCATMEVKVGGVDMCLDGGSWAVLEEDPLVDPDFVVVRRVVKTSCLLLDPKVEFVTESDETDKVVDAYFTLGQDAIADDSVKEEAEEQVLTLLSKLNFC